MAEEIRRFAPSQELIRQERRTMLIGSLFAGPFMLYICGGAFTPVNVALSALGFTAFTYGLSTLRTGIHGMQTFEFSPEALTITSSKGVHTLPWSQISSAQQMSQDGHKSWVFIVEDETVTMLLDGHPYEATQEIDTLIKQHLSAHGVETSLTAI